MKLVQRLDDRVRLLIDVVFEKLYTCTTHVEHLVRESALVTIGLIGKWVRGLHAMVVETDARHQVIVRLCAAAKRVFVGLSNGACQSHAQGYCYLAGMVFSSLTGGRLRMR